MARCNVLRSERAVEVSVLVVRAFVRMRDALLANAELAARVSDLERELSRQGEKLLTHDATLLSLLNRIKQLTKLPDPPTRPIGFTADVLGNQKRD